MSIRDKKSVFRIPFFGKKLQRGRGGLVGRNIKRSLSIS